jgi:hypothetical protein
MTFITHRFRVSVVSDVQERVRDLGSPLRFMLRRSSLVECVSVLHGTCLQCVNFFLSISMCSHVCQKILSIHFICECQRALYGIKCVLRIFDKHGCTYWWIKKKLTLCRHVPCNTLTHSTNEDLLNIKRKGGWAWNCQIIFRCVSIHGRAGLICKR